jgi:hypothetical protein
MNLLGKIATHGGKWGGLRREESKEVKKEENSTFFVLDFIDRLLNTF